MDELALHAAWHAGRFRLTDFEKKTSEMPIIIRLWLVDYVTGALSRAAILVISEGVYCMTEEG